MKKIKIKLKHIRDNFEKWVDSNTHYFGGEVSVISRAESVLASLCLCINVGENKCPICDFWGGVGEHNQFETKYLEIRSRSSASKKK